MSVYFQTWLLVCLFALVPVCLFALVLACLFAWMLACLDAFVLVCLFAFVLACLDTFVLLAHCSLLVLFAAHGEGIAFVINIVGTVVAKVEVTTIGIFSIVSC